MDKYIADGLADSAIELKESDLLSPRSGASIDLADPEDDRPRPGLVRQRVDHVSVRLCCFIFSFT